LSSRPRPAALFTDSAGEPVVRESFCAFLDVLGFRQRIETVRAVPSDLLTLLKAYLASTTLPESTLRTTADDIGQWRVIAFSDSVVLGHPLWTADGEAEFGSVQAELKGYQLALALRGLFVRGAVTVGSLFMNERLAFGPALVDAYDLERSKAQYPRVIFGPDMVKILKGHLKFYGDAQTAPHNEDLLVDADGEVFLNYLDEIVTDEGVPDECALQIHKNEVEKGLEKHQADLRISEKYRWLAAYHDYFVFLLGGRSSFRIDSARLTHRFTRFVP
jgi:hypothetical protein